MVKIYGITVVMAILFKVFAAPAEMFVSLAIVFILGVAAYLLHFRKAGFFATLKQKYDRVCMSLGIFLFITLACIVFLLIFNVSNNIPDDLPNQNKLFALFFLTAWFGLNMGFMIEEAEKKAIEGESSDTTLAEKM